MQRNKSKQRKITEEGKYEKKKKECSVCKGSHHKFAATSPAHVSPTATVDMRAAVDFLNGYFAAGARDRKEHLPAPVEGAGPNSFCINVG